MINQQKNNGNNRYKTLQTNIALYSNIIDKLLYIKNQILVIYDHLETFKNQTTPKMNKIYQIYQESVKKPYVLSIQQPGQPDQYITFELINIITAWNESIDTTSSIDKYKIYNLGRFGELFTAFYNLCIRPTISSTPMQTAALTAIKYIEAQIVVEKIADLMKKLVIKFYNTPPHEIISVLNVNTFNLIKIMPDLFTNVRLAMLRFDDLEPVLTKVVAKSKSRSSSGSSSSSKSKSESSSTYSVRPTCESLDIKGYVPAIQSQIVKLCSEMDSIKEQISLLDKKHNKIDLAKQAMYKNALKQKLQLIRNLLQINRHL